MRVTFDANVIVYALDPQAGVKRAVARRLLERGVLSDCVVTLQAICEALHATTRKGMIAHADALAAIEAVVGLMPTVCADAATPATAMAGVQRHGMSFWDAMLWATARQHGCDIIVTEDFQSGRLADGVTFLNPFGPALPPELDAALAPPEV